jgi:nucleotide-binding universal stress UspA family protein
MPARHAVRQFHHVLCPVDLSAHSRIALRYAAALAEQDRCSLTVLFVSDPLLVAAAAAAYNRRELEDTSGRELARFVKKALPPKTLAALSPVCEVRIGKPVDEIVRRASEGGFDLLVLGTRGHNAAGRLLFGSTTTGVLRRATIPVLAIPPAGRSGVRKRLAQTAAKQD